MYAHHQIYSDQQPSLEQPLTNIVTLSESQPTTDRRSCAGCYSRIQSIHVKAQMYRLIPARVDPIDRHLDDLPNPITIDFVHGEGCNVVLAENGFLACVDVAQADIGELGGVEMDSVEPREGSGFGGGRFADGGVSKGAEEGERHAVDVSCGTALVVNMLKGVWHR